jgi:hypothetical protein
MIYQQYFKDYSGYHKLTDKEKVIFHLQEHTNWMATKLASMDHFMSATTPEEQHTPFYGFDFYFTNKFLSLCVEKRFIEEDRIGNLREAKSYLYMTVEKIIDNLRDTQLWRSAGSKFVLDIDTNNCIALISATNGMTKPSGEVYVNDGAEMIRGFMPIDYTAEEILEDKNKRILAVQKSDFSSVISKNLEYLIKETKINNLSFNSQFSDYVTNKCFLMDKNVWKAEDFLKERLKSIVNAAKDIDRNEDLVIHYDERVGTVLKNGRGKYLLRIPEVEQLNKIRSNIGNSSKSKIMQNKL